MEDRNPRILTYAMAIAELIVHSEGQKEKLLEEKFEALRKSWSLLELYANDGFDERILDVIMEKKARMILDAATIKDVRELSVPPKPQYTGNSWVTSKNAVPEEEMIWWSKASLRAPLNHEATQRYMELFKNFYGRSVEEIMGGGGNPS